MSCPSQAIPGASLPEKSIVGTEVLTVFSSQKKDTNLGRDGYGKKLGECIACLVLSLFSRKDRGHP